VGNRPLVLTDPSGLAGTGDTRREDQRLLKEKEEKKEAYEDVEKRFEKWEDDTKPYERIVPENDPSRVLDNDLYWGDDFRTYLHSLSDADGKVIAELTNQELDDLYINYHQLRQASYEEVALPAQMMLLPAIGSAQAAMNLGMPLAKPIQPGYGKDIAAAKAAGRGTTSVADAVVHGNSLSSTKPTWGYKLFSEDGTFLKNGITSKTVPETRYTKSFMQDKFMEKQLFPNRRAAYDWEFGQNQIQRGPLNLNMH
jgi:uncharacterized protein YhaN